MNEKNALLKIQFDGEATDLLPRGTPISRDFWESPTLDELAQAQNVKPMMDVSALIDRWPGETDGGFEKAVDESRHSRIGAGELS